MFLRFFFDFVTEEKILFFRRCKRWSRSEKKVTNNFFFTPAFQLHLFRARTHDTLWTKRWYGLKNFLLKEKKQFLYLLEPRRIYSVRQNWRWLSRLQVVVYQTILPIFILTHAHTYTAQHFYSCSAANMHHWCW